MELVVSEDIILRLPTAAEAETRFAVIHSNRTHLRQWLPWVDGTQTVEDTAKYIEFVREQYEKNASLQVTIWYKRQMAGIAGIHQYDWANKKASIGYWLAEAFQGKGIMPAVVKALLDYAFGTLHLNRIEIRCATGNHRSRAIPERLGFVREGLCRDSEWLYDHYVDHVVYSMLAREWMGGSRLKGNRFA